MPTIIVQDLQHVIVDGTNYGAVADTIINNKELASDVQRALVTWNEAQLTAAQKSATDAAAAAAKDKETALTTKDEEYAGIIKAIDKTSAERNAALAAQKTAEDDLASFKARAQGFLSQFSSVDHPDVAAIVQAGAAELNKSARQKELEDAQATADAANARVEALKNAQFTKAETLAMAS